MRLSFFAAAFAFASLSVATVACSAPVTDESEDGTAAVSTGKSDARAPKDDGGSGSDAKASADASTTPAKCGGFLNLKCSGETYCDYGGPGSGCGKGDKPGTCVAKPPPCPATFAPVCACNGKTFDNACEAQRAGFSVSTTGECAVEDE